MTVGELTTSSCLFDVSDKSVNCVSECNLIDKKMTMIGRVENFSRNKAVNWLFFSKAT